MKTRWQALRNKYWNSRSTQERSWILWGAAILLPVIYYFLLWQPAHQAATKLQKSLPSLRAQSIRLNQQATEVEALRHRPQLPPLSLAALKTSIEESAARHQLSTAITTLELQEPNGIHLSCETIPFASWLAWLRNLQQEQGILADSVSISALPQAGMVKVSATLLYGNNP